MAIANSDGSIVLSVSVDTSGATKGANSIKKILNSVGNTTKAIGIKIEQSLNQKDTIKLLSQGIKDQEALIKKLNDEYAQLVVSKGQDAQATKNLKSQIDKENATLKDLKKTLSSIGNTKPVTQASKAFVIFGKRLLGIVKSALIFSVLYKVMKALVKVFSSVLMGNEDFVESINELKAALWVMVTPLLNVVIPAIKTMVNWLTQAAIAVGKFFATISGKSYNALIEQAKGFQDMSKSAKDAKKQLAGFDDLQILYSNKGEETNQPNFEALKTEGGDNAPNVSEQLSAIIAGVGGLIAAIGLILLLKTVNPIAHSIGIGMIIAGAGIFAVGAVQMAANNMDEEISNMLHGIITVASGFALAIGLILLFSGQTTPLSIGLVVTGAVGLGSEIALYPDAVKTALQGWIGGILAIISTALLVIGIVLVCCGVVSPLSIGMIVVGATGLATEIALNFDTIIEALRGTIGIITAIVSAALLVIGIILVCTGAGIPLGIGLIIAGAVGLAAVVAVNWNLIVDKTTEIFQKFGGIIAAAGVALIVLGIILCCTGVGIGLGIGLIIAGAAGIAGAVAFNWNAIVEWVKNAWNGVKEFWNSHIAQIFTKEWWINLAKKCGNGLISGFEKAINGIIGMFEKMINWIVDGLNKISFDVPDWVPGIGGKTFGFNIPEVKFGRVSIPRLAKGAVIPPNREFLAVLGDQKHGTNIEAPLQTIVDAFNIALAQNGGANNGNIEVVLEIDGREFGRAVVEQGNRENRRIGTRLVIV